MTWQDEMLLELEQAAIEGRTHVLLDSGPAKVRVYKSRSDPMGVHYRITFPPSPITGESLDICTCRGFRYRDHCWHVEEPVDKGSLL